MRRISSAIAAVFLSAAPLLWAAPKEAYRKIEVVRDTWGVPHVFSDTDEGAMYGLGYATAQERGFQMTYGLRIIQGRLAEVIGPRTRPGRQETAVDHDRRMRTFGWARAAARTAPNLDADTRRLLDAYCEGVNDSFAVQKASGDLHPLFRELGVTPEPWTPADCLLSWWHLAQFFATDGTRDLMVWRNRVNPPAGRPVAPTVPQRSWVDDEAAVVQRADVPERWISAVERFAATHELETGSTSGEGPKFSHAWVVGGRRNTSGAAVLVSDPQTPVRNPSLWMEFHISGKTFNARGIGVPGSPALLIGFTPRVAWGLTALGADQADLFRLETAQDRPDEYRWEGRWRKMEVRTEVIAVKGGQPVTIKVREAHLGPIVSEFAYRQAGDPEVALKRVPLCESDRDTVRAVFGMMRSSNVQRLLRATADWRFPSANCVFGDAKGGIGFSVVGAMPIRPKSAPDRGGNEAIAGRGDLDDWQGFVPAELLPQVMNPRAGLLLSANHRPIGAFYGIPLGTSTGSLGDTIRSWRLRERLLAEERFTPEQVLDVHYDSVNPARRDIVRLGLHVRETAPAKLSEDANKALAALKRWVDAGGSSDARQEGAELATRISTFFRFIATPLAFKFGGGESGLARFLKDATRRVKTDPQVLLEDEEVAFIDKVLAEAWTASGTDARGGQRNSARGATGERRAPARQNLGWFESLDGFGSLERAQDLPVPGITCLDGQTILSQAAQSYTQWVPLHDPDSARTICPIGHSDRPQSPYRTSTLKLWGEAKLHPAPLSRKAVEKIAEQKVWLAR